MGAGHEVAGKRPTKEPPRRVRYDRVRRTTRTIEQGANRSWRQKVGQMSRVSQSRPLVGLRSKTSLNTYGDLSPGWPSIGIRGPEGRLKLDLGCYESAVPDRLKVDIATRRATCWRGQGPKNNVDCTNR